MPISAMTRQQIFSTDTLNTSTQHLDHSFFWGKWDNTDASSKGFSHIEFFNDHGALMLRAFGTGSTEKRLEVGLVAVDVFSDSIHSLEGTKFSADFDFTWLSVSLHGWVKQGVLVISVFNTYKEQGKRRHYFCREFFYAAQE